MQIEQNIVNKNRAVKPASSIPYFLFEEDFIEKNVRCIPMIVRFKLDAVGIKLQLSQWSRFAVDDRIRLAVLPCTKENEISQYRAYLEKLIKEYCCDHPTYMTVDHDPEWNITGSIPGVLQNRLNESGYLLTIHQWKELSVLQRFALVKLSRSKHEHKNFPKAMREFGLVN
jgi:hypothetical protein